MLSYKFLFLAILLISIVYSFNPSDYVYPNEKDVKITYDNFTFQGIQYSLIKFNGVETFLLKNDAPLRNTDQISEILYSYYLSSYYPTEQDIADLTSAITLFNTSRNDGYGSFKGKEEYACRGALLYGLKVGPNKTITCTDIKTCKENAALLFQYLDAQGAKVGSPDVLLVPLMDFTPYSLLLDDLLTNYTQRLSSMDVNSATETLKYIRDTSPQIKNYSNKIEQTIFRTPRSGDDADRKACLYKCIGLCPALDLDQNAADLINSRAAALYKKVEPLGSYQAVSSKIYQNTVSRFKYVNYESSASYYSDQYTGLLSESYSSLTLAKDLLVRINDFDLSSSVSRFIELNTSIPQRIQARNITSLDADLNEFDLLIKKINLSSSTISLSYSNLSKKKNLADLLISSIETTELDPVSLDRLSNLKTNLDELNRLYSSTITPDQISLLDSKYAAIISEANSVLNSKNNLPVSQGVIIFRDFAKNLNSGISEFYQLTKIASPSQIIENQSMYLGGFSIVIFLSFSAIVSFIFLHALVSNKRNIPRIKHVMAVFFLCCIIVVLGFSVFLYVLLSRTATHATLDEFNSVLESGNTVAVFVDIKSAPFSDSQSISDCASKVTNYLQSKNKPWTKYVLSSDSCTVSDSSKTWKVAVSDCFSTDYADTSIYMHYSSSNLPPKFSTAYVNKAEINGNSAYYSSCPTATMFG